MPLTLTAGIEPVPGYALVRPLGRGGFGEVWEALAPGGIHVALKFIQLETAQAGAELRALEVIRNIAVAGEANEKVERLYPTKEAMDRLVAEDEDAFLTALDKAVGQFLPVGTDQDKPMRDFPEPIGAIARLYVKDLGLAEVAAGLGLKDPNELKTMIEGNPALRRLGLGPLLQPEGRIKRAAWESLQFFNSPFQETALQLELGMPRHEHLCS